MESQPATIRDRIQDDIIGTQPFCNQVIQLLFFQYDTSRNAIFFMQTQQLEEKAPCPAKCRIFRDEKGFHGKVFRDTRLRKSVPTTDCYLPLLPASLALNLARKGRQSRNFLAVKPSS